MAVAAPAAHDMSRDPGEAATVVLELTRTALRAAGLLDTQTSIRRHRTVTDRHARLGAVPPGVGSSSQFAQEPGGLFWAACHDDGGDQPAKASFVHLGSGPNVCFSQFPGALGPYGPTFAP